MAAGKESTLTKLSFAGEAVLKDGALSHSYTGLPKYNKNGGVIIYYVKEETTGNFKTLYTSSTGAPIAETAVTADAIPHSIENDTDQAFYVNIINTPLTKLTVSKVWEDDNDAFKLRPDAITLTLQRAQTDGSGNDVDETAWENVSYEGLKETNASPSGVSKAADGSAVVSLTKAGSWSDQTIDKLPLFALGNGNVKTKLRYRLAEQTVPGGYTAAYADVTTDAYDQKCSLTNTLIRRESIKAEKLWNTEADTEKKPVTVTLYSRNALTGEDDGVSALTAVEGINAERTLNADFGWETEYEDLPLYNKDGNEIVYYLKEKAVPGQSYTTVYETGSPYASTAEENVKTAGNTAFSVRVINSPYTQASVEKRWADADDRFHTRPEKTYAALQRREGDTGAYSFVTWTEIPDNPEAAAKIAAGKGSEKAVFMLNTANSWKKALTKLPHYKAYTGSIVRYDYRFIETDETGEPCVPFGYSLVSADTDYTKTNDGSESGYENTVNAAGCSTVITNTLIVKTARVIKTWEDNSDAPGIRPESLRIYITEDTAKTGSTDSFNGKALGGITASAPFGATPFSSVTESVAPVKSNGNNVWTYTFTGLPRYAYGADAAPDAPKEIIYRGWEDTEYNDNGFILKNYYETVQDTAADDETRITNTVMPNDGSLILEKAIQKWNEQESDFDYAFPFKVKLTRPDGEVVPFAGTYYLYDRAEVGSLTTPLQLRTDAISDTSAFSRTESTTANGIVRIAPGKIAVLTGINSRYTYSVTEEPTKVGYNVIRINHTHVGGSDDCTATYPVSGDVTVAGDTANTKISKSSYEQYYGIITGQIIGMSGNPAYALFTNKLFGPETHSLKIENTTQHVTTAEGEELTGGKVRIYKKLVVVENENSVGGNNAYDYEDEETPEVEEAMTVQFEADTEHGYSYGDSLKILWWKDGEDVNGAAPNSITISGYIDSDPDESGKIVPYTGSISAENSGNGTGGNQVPGNGAGGKLRMMSLENSRDYRWRSDVREQ